MVSITSIPTEEIIVTSTTNQNITTISCIQSVITSTTIQPINSSTAIYNVIDVSDQCNYIGLRGSRDR